MATPHAHLPNAGCYPLSAFFSNTPRKSFRFAPHILYRLCFQTEGVGVPPTENLSMLPFAAMKTIILLLLLLVPLIAMAADPEKRPRARDLGVKIGILPTGPLNAITDVPE